MTSRDEQKRRAAHAAVELVEAGTIVGVGTGSTANHFVDRLAASGIRIAGAVASSRATAERLRRAGVRVVELNDAGELPLYVDGADEVDPERRLIKGGGGAMTREKIVATASRVFACIVDESKLVARLGAFPVAVEVLSFARESARRGIERLGGRVEPRTGFTTDDGNAILDVRGLPLEDPRATEEALDHVPGIVAHGLFCRRRADVVLVGGADGVRRIP